MSVRTGCRDNPDTVEGIVLLQKGDDADPVLKGIHEEVDKPVSYTHLDAIPTLIKISMAHLKERNMV